MLRRVLLCVIVLCAALPAHAVIVRGKVMTALGQPLPGARVQLIRLLGGPKNAADTISGVDGAYELRTDLAGRFLLLTSPSVMATQFAPQVGEAFYGGRTDLLTIDIALDASAITPQESGQTALLVMPLRRMAEAVVQVAADELLTHATVIPELRDRAGVEIVQAGQTGAPAALLLRGAPVEKTVIDGVSAEELGGRFNLETMTPTGLAAVASSPAMELTAGANPLYGTDAGAGVLSFDSARAGSMHPVLTYTGDAGVLSTVRNEAVGTIVHSRADALVAFSRFNTDNDVPAARIHLVSAAGDLGYQISGNTGLRLTLRDDVDAAPLASPFVFYEVAPATKLASQDLVGGFTFETRTAGNWHNLLRYGMVRDRSEAFEFSSPAAGLPVTITGANGSSASGVATFLPVPAREDAVTNRDEVTYQTDYPVTHFLTALLTARYADERGSDVTAAQTERLERTHLSVAGELEGQVRHRLFYEASGLIDHATMLGLHGAPRVGLTYVPVRQGTRKFRGTSLHGTAATGLREPSALETELLRTPVEARSRTFDVAVDQSILRKLTARATYFHDQLSHETETLGLAPLALGNHLAYRTQGLESELRFQPAPRLLIDAGYMYLASLVEQSSATASGNPNLPGVAIGATTALVGQRPFQRAPNTGFVNAQYTGTAFTASLKAAFSGESDGTTGLVLNPTLLLPNRNLSPGYASVDASFTYRVTHAVTFFTQMTNLLDERHMAPIGYVSTPFLIRAGLRVRLGHE